MSNESMRDFGTVITRLINKEDLSFEETKEVISQVLLDEQPEMQQGAFLAALKAKGETAKEIAAIWETIYDIDTVKVNPEVSSPLVETSGTGMDSLNTFNISTGASIITAAAGINIAKHGSRAITSVTGTVDILETIGIDVESDPQIVKKSIENAGIGIFNGMSPKVHPRALGRILSKVFFSTTLNIAASLANPVLPKYGVRGVYTKKLLKPAALIMKEIGYKKAIVVHGLNKKGDKGMDEASTLGETLIVELEENGEIEEYSFMPEDVGIKSTTPEKLLPYKNREKEAVRLIKVLKGEENGPCTDIVCLNAALVLYLMGLCKNIKRGVIKAQEIINSGSAIKKLKKWIKEQNSEPQIALERFNELSNNELANIVLKV